MRHLSILLLWAIFCTKSAYCAALSQPAPPKSDPASSEAIVLFGARWCAPCMQEWQNLPELARAAAPRLILLAWVDRPIAVPVGSPSGPLPNVQALDLSQARQLADQFGGTGYGLPMAQILRNGRPICPVWRKPLSAGNLGAMLASCRN